ncbi:MAG: ribosome maturation factor RimM [Rikenellaceae bacterium]
MQKEQSLTAIARISKLYGVKGEVVVRLYDEFPDEIYLEEPMFIYVDELRVPLFVSSFSARGVNKAIMVFDDFESELRISEFIGTELYMPTNLLGGEDTDEDEDGEIYFENLVGYKMFDTLSGRMGEILSHIDYENNPVFIVDFDGVEVMVPAADEIIADIYIDALVVEAAVPEGLYEFYETHNS